MEQLLFCFVFRQSCNIAAYILLYKQPTLVYGSFLNLVSYN